MLPNPCVVHANVRNDVSAFVSHCDVHGLANSLAFFSAALIYRGGAQSAPPVDDELRKQIAALDSSIT